MPLELSVPSRFGGIPVPSPLGLMLLEGATHQQLSFLHESGAVRCDVCALRVTAYPGFHTSLHRYVKRLHVTVTLL